MKTNRLWHSRPRPCGLFEVTRSTAGGGWATTSPRISLRSAVVGCALLAFFLTLACQREATVAIDAGLAAQLKTIRDGLSLYAKQHGRYPQSLEAMVASGILKEIPTDPVTKSKSTWKLVREESVAVNEFSTDVPAASESAPIVDVRSGAGGADARGVPWSEY